ncbi:MAG TPA: hypothetical protein VGM02_09775 [Acidobacteriaceae bacterium]|jgi:hypothetical protein
MDTALRILAVIVLALSIPVSAAALPAAQESAPLPDVPSLLRSVEAHQTELDRAREEYTFRQQQQLTMYDKHGKVRHTEAKTSNVFFVHGQPIETLISKNGKPLSAGDLKKEQDHATKEAVKYAAQPYGQRDKDDVSVSRLLAITRFSNPRRVMENGRPVIAVDFIGDPHAKTHGRNEDAIKKVRGTVWIDEAAREVTRMNATFDEPLRIGFGLFATVDAGSNFSFEQALIRNEAWLPTRVDARFDGKAALFVGFHVDLSVRFDQYQKFSASATEHTALPQP